MQRFREVLVAWAHGPSPQSRLWVTIVVDVGYCHIIYYQD